MKKKNETEINKQVKGGGSGNENVMHELTKRTFGLKKKRNRILKNHRGTDT